MQATWLDRAILRVSPVRAVKRIRARITHDVIRANYEAASTGRRTLGERRHSGDANAAIGPSLSLLRDRARDLVRNNGHAESAVGIICDQAVGRGIQAAAQHDLWEKWANSTACDADGRNDLYGLQKLVMRTVVESGEVLVRRRWRRASDGLPLPMQLQVLEPDFLDTSRDRNLTGGAKIVQGVEFDPIGRRSAYWLFSEHPGSMRLSTGTRLGQSVRVPASEVLHVFRQSRPGQVRGPSWFAPVWSRMREYDKYADATLMKQLIAACLAVFTTDTDGTGPALGTENADDASIDSIEPGQINNLAPGRDVHIVNPPSVREHGDYTQVTLREIATGMGLSYEDYTGDYTRMPFSAARMSRLRQWKRVEGWRGGMLIPQFLNPVWTWTQQAAALVGGESIESTEWTAPPLPMIEPDKEGRAVSLNVRAGIMTLPEAIRERGHNPKQFYQELLADQELRDELGLILDSDARYMTQAGQAMNAKWLADAGLMDDQ